jgi:hypothetical protein
MISNKHKCIFIHIPRTGGTSIENTIWPKVSKRQEKDLWNGFIDDYNNKYQTGGLQHLLGYQIKNIVGPEVYNDYYKFTIVRNPYDKIVSQFFYINKRKDLQTFLAHNKGDEFKFYLDKIAKKKHVQWEPQVNFVLDENGETIVDFIGKFENFNNEVTKVLEKTGLDKKYFGLVKRSIPHINQTVRNNYQTYYDDESKEMVEQLFKKDLEFFNYKF